MAIFKKFSLLDWLKQFGHCISRFPISVVLLVLLSGYLIYFNHVGGVTEKWHFFFIFYLATGALLGVSLQLLTEDFKHRLTAFITQFVVHALWLGISFYLAQFDRFSLPQLLGVFATVVAIGLSVFLMCFYRKGDDVPFWNFSLQTVVAIIAGVVVGGVLTLGLLLFAQSLEWLFGVQVSNSVFGDIPTVCMVLLAPLLFMNLIPAGEEKRLSVVQSYSPFLKGVVQYLFIPLLLLYMVTLYVYAAKILLSWQLPVGWVSYLVTASMLGMVIILYLTYPLQHEQGKSFFKAVTRWLPLAMLPLLALMTVAIGRRLSDYGITVSRLYVLVFNIWCYIVCIGLLLCRNRRIWWVPASFAVILFLISVGPQSIANVTQRHLLTEASKAFTASGIKQLPLSGERYAQWLKTADPKVAAAIDGKLAYLQRDFGYESIAALVGKDAVLGTQASLVSVDGQNTTLPEYRNDKLIRGVAAPQGYATMNLVSCYFDNIKINNGKLVIELEADGVPEKCQFEIDVKGLADRDMDSNPVGHVKPVIVDNGKALLVMDEFYLRKLSQEECFFRCSGVLFTK